MDVIGYIVTCFLFFTLATYIVSKINNSNSKNKTATVLDDTSVFKIRNKKCSVKRISRQSVGGRPVNYHKCDIFISPDFIIIRGNDNLIFNNYVTTFALFKCKPAGVSAWSGKIFRLVATDLAVGKTQIKIVYQTDYNAVYSLIIRGLDTTEFEKLSVISNWPVSSYS